MTFAVFLGYETRGTRLAERASVRVRADALVVLDFNHGVRVAFHIVFSLRLEAIVSSDLQRLDNVVMCGLQPEAGLFVFSYFIS